MARIEYHKNNPLYWKWIILGLIISFLLITSPIFFFFYPFASTEKKSYFHGKNPILFNVVSPTWFSLADNDGTIKNLASLVNSKWAKSKGFQVLGLFSNAFNPTLTHEALKDFKTRKRIILQLLHFSHIYLLQGINFDIENVNKEDGKLVTQLIREATPYLHEAGLIVSLDITFSAGENNNWSSFYERKELAQIADYLIVMAYDEHTVPVPVQEV